MWPAGPEFHPLIDRAAGIDRPSADRLVAHHGQHFTAQNVWQGRVGTDQVHSDPAQRTTESGLVNIDGHLRPLPERSEPNLIQLCECGGVAEQLLFGHQRPGNNRVGAECVLQHLVTQQPYLIGELIWRVRRQAARAYLPRPGATGPWTDLL